MVSDLAVNLLIEKSSIKIISLVAIQDNEVIGHIAFSPVFSMGSRYPGRFIRGRCRISPHYQKNKIGSSLVHYGLDTISNMGSYIIFVYGDPQYYSRFGFNTDLAKNFPPQHSLQHPEGWQALKLDSSIHSEGGTIKCVDSLDDPNLW